MLISRARLRVTSDELTAEDLVAALGSPTGSFSKGDTYSVKPKIRAFSMWYLDAPEDGRSLADQISFLLNSLTENRQFLESDGKNCEVDLFCGLRTDNGQGSATLNPKLLGEAERLGIPIILDMI